MKTKNIIYPVLIGIVSALTLTSCNDFLDTMPDNRTTLDSQEKISDLLVTAYPSSQYAVINELISDNTDYYGATNPNGDRFGDQLFFWKDITEASNEAPYNLWLSCYKAAAAANQALASLDELKQDNEKARTSRAEALLCRAYAHFVLVNEFSLNYNSKTSATDPGIPVTTSVEAINVKKDRGNVAQVYEQIERDIQAALPLMSDNYTVPKYHFNKRAAYAFATRFYLFYEKWDKAVEYANLCLGTNPGANLRDWKVLGGMAQKQEALANHYIDASLNCNLLLSTFHTSAGLYLGAYTYYKRYSHGRYLGDNEDMNAVNVWGTANYYEKPLSMAGSNFDVCLMMKIPYLFEYKDPVARTGYHRTVLALFTMDETLLNRAEAYIMLKQYDKAAADMNVWMHNITNTSVQLTPKVIQKFYESVAYSYSDQAGIMSTVKKHLHPAFSIDEEGSVQETMLQCVLGFRRIETMHYGNRWWDVKRYGIEIVRREMGADGKPSKLLDVMKKDDPRRAIQIPMQVREAGMAANPRNQ